MAEQPSEPQDPIEFLPSDPEQTFESGIGPREQVVSGSDDLQTRSATPTQWTALPDIGDSDDSPTIPYVFRSLIGRGGFGEVWEAVQVSLNRTVAVKKLHIKEGSILEGEELKLLFRNEAYTTAALDHPNIVPVYDFGRDEAGRPMMAMKLVRGTSWSTSIREDFLAMTPQDFLAKHLPILADVAQAVAFAHDAGVVHRDLKPGQVMLGSYGEVLLMDWGLAVTMGAAAQSPEQSISGRVAPSPLEASSPAGTPAYMAPEQTMPTAAKVGPWTDMYLLGGILFVLLTGTRPHDAPTAAMSYQMARSAMQYNPRTRKPGRHMPDDLVELTMHAMAPRAEDRLTSAKEFLHRLQEHLSGAARRRESAELAAVVKARATTQSPDYAQLAAMVNELDRARLLWPENPEANALRARLIQEQTESAIAVGDFQLARVTLQQIEQDGVRTQLGKRLELAVSERNRRERERRTLRFATAALLSLVFVGGSWFLIQLQREKQIAINARDRADGARRRSDELLGFVIGDVGKRLANVGRLELLDEVLVKASEFLKQTEQEGQTPEDRRNRLSLIHQLADVAHMRGKVSEAAELLKQAEPIRAQVLALGTAEDLSLSANILRVKGVVENNQGARAEARASFEEAMRIARDLEERFPNDPISASASNGPVLNLVQMLEADGNLAECLATMRELRGRTSQTLVRFPESITVKSAYAVHTAEVGRLMAETGNEQESFPLFEESLKLLEALKDEDAANLTHALEFGKISGIYARLLLSEGRLGDGHRRAVESVSILSALSVNNPSNMELRNSMLVSRSLLASYHENRKEYGLAAQEFARIVEQLEYIASLDPSALESQKNLAIVLSRLGLCRYQDGKPNDAIVDFRRSIQLFEDIAARSELTSELSFMISHTTQRLATALAASGDAPGAEKELVASIARVKAQFEIFPDDVATAEVLRAMYHDHGNLISGLDGRREDAKQAYREALSTIAGLLKREKPQYSWKRDYVRSASALSNLLIADKEFDEATRLTEVAEGYSREVFLMNTKNEIWFGDWSRSLRRRASVLQGIGRTEEAKAFLDECVSLLDSRMERPAVQTAIGRASEAWIRLLPQLALLKESGATVDRALAGRMLELLEPDLAAEPGPEVAESWETAALAYILLGERAKAEELIVRILAVKRGALAVELRPFASQSPNSAATGS